MEKSVEENEQVVDKDKEVFQEIVRDIDNAVSNLMKMEEVQSFNFNFQYISPTQSFFFLFWFRLTILLYLTFFFISFFF